MQALDVDEQLGLFYFVYKEIAQSHQPPQEQVLLGLIAEGLFNQVKDMPHEQLQLQRDLINKADSEYTRMYGSMSETTKLLFWYRLAQGWIVLLSFLCLQTIRFLPKQKNY